MFIETHKDGNLTLTFIKSENIQVFPSGRRGAIVDTNNNMLPFDPEARLNTEANNRKQSGLGGYTQEYLKDWNQDARVLTLSLAGYLFDINLPEINTTLLGGQEPTTLDTRLPNDFGRAVVDALTKRVASFIENDTGDTPSLEDELSAIRAANAIYANILIEEVKLYSGSPKDYFTSILRDQSDQSSSVGPATSLDLSAASGYYFSGLSFSTKPLTGKAGGGTKTRDSLPYKRTDGNGTILARQQLVSLRVLEKSEDVWKIHEPARLPKIEHGSTTDSIVVGDTTAMSLTTANGTVTQELRIQNTSHNAKIIADTAEITRGLVVKGTITATDPENLVNNYNINAGAVNASAANISTLTGDTATITNINADDIQQKVDGTHRDVPVIFLEQVDGEYQLQIKRVNKLN